MATRPEFLDVAQIVTTVGVKGELKVKPLTDDPLRLKGLKSVTAVLANGERLVLHPEAVKLRADGVVIAKFAEYGAPETAAVLRQAVLQIPFAEAKREKGKVLYADLLGMQVVDDTSGAAYGTVSEVYKAAQDILEVKTPDGRDVLVPWVDEFVKKVDLEAQEVRIQPIEGLFEA